jgi:hypothetical protein
MFLTQGGYKSPDVRRPARAPAIGAPAGVVRYGATGDSINTLLARNVVEVARWSSASAML